MYKTIIIAFIIMLCGAKLPFLFAFLSYLLSGNDNFLSEKREERKEKREEYKKKRQSSDENCRFFLAGMNRATSNCTPLTKRQNIYWFRLSVEKIYVEKMLFSAIHFPKREEVMF